MILYTLHLILSVLYSEIVLRMSAYSSPQLTLQLVLFSAAAGLLMGAVCSLFRKKGTGIVALIFNVLIFAFYAVHLVYQYTFKSFLSITQTGMGMDAVTTYIREVLISIWNVKFYLIAMLIPVIAAIVLLKKYRPRKTGWLYGVIFIAAAAAVHIAAVAALPLAGSGAYSPEVIYKDTFVLSLSEKAFGTLTSARLELRGLFFGTGTGQIAEETPVEVEPETEPEKVYPYNALDIDFASLAASETDETVKALHEYFASKQPTRQNEMTGVYEGYNVVQLVCESFSPYLLDEERTPMLYKMATEGYVFNNYYSTISDNTSNSEYVAITGLLPDSSLLGKGWTTFYDYNSCTTSKNNSEPFTLANQYKALGYKSWGFHNYYGTYYGRKDSHPNFGMDFYYMTHGLKKTTDWPTSDLEMMQQALTNYVLKDGSSSPFYAYFLSFSGHMQYNFDTNNMAKKNKDVSADLPYSTAVKAYVSGNEELEYAVEYLVEALEEAGQLDNTLIVIAPDHYPYALGLDPLSELAGTDLDADDYGKEFNTYKGCLLMWTSTMTEPVTVDKYCCELDILPTLSNLLGLEFDSRLLMGTDIFSDSEGIAILGDRSFVTEDFAYDANLDKIYPADGVSEADAQSGAQRYMTIVKNKFKISTDILYNDYYSKVIQ